jgi:hypothetical protein
MTFKNSDNIIIYKIQNQTSYVKTINTNLLEINKNKKNPYLSNFVKTIEPAPGGGNYVKTFINYK